MATPAANVSGETAPMKSEKPGCCCGKGGCGSKGRRTFTILPVGAKETVEASAERIREEFARTGVVILPGFLNAVALSEVNRELEDYYRPIAHKAHEIHAGASGDTAKFACDIIPWDPVRDGNATFNDLARDAKLAEVSEIVLGEGYTAPSSLVMFSVGGGRGQAWHQDCPAEYPESFNLNRLFYTADVDLADGAIVFVPGSHKAGRIPPGGHQDPMDGEIALEPRAGTLVLLHGHVYHRVTPNLNNRPRTSVNYRAYPKGVSSDVNCIGIYRNGTVNFCEKHRAKEKAEVPMMKGPAA